MAVGIAAARRRDEQPRRARPSPVLSSRSRRFVGLERVPDLEARYRDYAAAAALLGR